MFRKLKKDIQNFSLYDFKLVKMVTGQIWKKYLSVNIGYLLLQQHLYQIMVSAKIFTPVHTYNTSKFY